jgi:small-conductance mechanosensitive channel
LVLALFALLSAVAFAAEQTTTLERFNERLDAARATLDDVEKALADPSLNDATLRSLRDRVDTLPAELQDVVDRLAPRLAGLQARLDELAGPALPAAETKDKPAEPPPAPQKREDLFPAPGKGARGPANGKLVVAKAMVDAKPAPASTPPADGDSLAAASVNAEWAEQKKLYDEVDATLKRARALTLEARQTALTIRARQRALFAGTLFLRTSGLFSPALWSAALQEAPYDAKVFVLLL